MNTITYNVARSHITHKVIIHDIEVAPGVVGDNVQVDRVELIRARLCEIAHSGVAVHPA
jgi:hypothetical protein